MNDREKAASAASLILFAFVSAASIPVGTHGCLTRQPQIRRFPRRLRLLLLRLGGIRCEGQFGPHCGCAAAGTEPRGGSPHAAVAVGCAGALVSALCAAAARMRSNKAKAIGVHVALLMLVAFAGVFAWRASLVYGVEEKAYLFRLLVVMAAGSAATLGLLVAYKPKPAKQE